jgi:hypothetical protein
VRHTLRSNGSLRLKACRAGVFRFASKLTAERRHVVHVASSRRLREDEVKDGQVNATSYIRLFYPIFAVFILLGPRDILVF